MKSSLFVPQCDLLRTVLTVVVHSCHATLNSSSMKLAILLNARDVE